MLGSRIELNAGPCGHKVSMLLSSIPSPFCFKNVIPIVKMLLVMNHIFSGMFSLPQYLKTIFEKLVHMNFLSSKIFY